MKRLKWLFELLARVGKSITTLRGTFVSTSSNSDDTDIIWEDGEPGPEQRK
ncbi:MAG: hypothetical protein V4436_00830 [Patescibacteria group bacterium]